MSDGGWSIMMNSGAVGSGKIKIDNNTFLKQLRQDYPILNTKFDMGSFELFGVRVVQVYTAYPNEASLAVESVFNEIRPRLRGFNGERLIKDYK